MKRIAGLLVLLVVIAAVVMLAHGRRGTPPPPETAPDIVVNGYVGGEKVNFLADPEVRSILHDRYRLSVTAEHRGSLEMVDPNLTKTDGIDFLWPSSQVALEMYKNARRPMTGNELLFNSPIVLYSWAPVTDALVKQGVVRKVQGAYYVVDFPRLIQMVNSGREWKSIGLGELYGRVTIFSTDPTLSNSGNMLAGLLADVLNGGQVVNESSLPHVMPIVRKFFDNQGYMEQGSDLIFQQYLNKGMGDKPLIVGYESQLIEYSTQDDAGYKRRKADLRMLYPRPTVWSSHPFIALTDNGKELMTAFEDKDIQRIAWEKHGFRSATGYPNDVNALSVKGIPDTVVNVIPMPSARTMDAIIKRLKS